MVITRFVLTIGPNTIERITLNINDKRILLCNKVNNNEHEGSLPDYPNTWEIILTRIA